MPKLLLSRKINVCIVINNLCVYPSCYKCESVGFCDWPQDAMQNMAIQGLGSNAYQAVTKARNLSELLCSRGTPPAPHHRLAHQPALAAGHCSCLNKQPLWPVHPQPLQHVNLGHVGRNSVEALPPYRISNEHNVLSACQHRTEGTARYLCWTYPRTSTYAFHTPFLHCPCRYLP
jgi:hypothetical protein